MPVIYDDPNKRRRYDAFHAVDKAGINPLERAIQAAKELDSSIDLFVKKLSSLPDDIQFKAQKILQDMRAQSCKLWIEIAEYVYSKPKPEHFDPERDGELQKVINKTQMLELLQKLNYPDKKGNGATKSNGNGNGASH